METSGPGMKGIVRLQFPGRGRLAPRAAGKRRHHLVDAAVAKISRYLQDGKNSAYAETKLLGALRGAEVAVRQYMEDVALRPKKAASTVIAPTDFSFRFWTHLSNLVLQDFRAKAEKTDQDMAVVQSAYILGYAVFHKKGAVQREKEWADDRKSLETQMRKAPFVFGFQDLYSLKDDKGATFVAKHSRDFIHSFLKEKTKRTGEETIPYLVRVHATAQKRDYFIHRDFVVPVFLKKLVECAEELRRHYLDEWTAALKEDRTPGPGEERLRLSPGRGDEGDPRVSPAHRPGKRRDPVHPGRGSPHRRRCEEGAQEMLRRGEHPAALRRAARAFEGHAAEECADVSPLLDDGPDPRRVLPVIAADVPRAESATRGRQRGIRRGASRAAAGGEDRRAPGGGRGGAERHRTGRTFSSYKRSVQSLVSQYVPKGSTIDATLADLAEKWNPLYASAQKKNLVEDVNALVRDFLRPIRRSFLVRPPDLKRIHALAEQLSTSKSLAQIKKRDVLMRYIELYMVRCLQVKQI